MAFNVAALADYNSQVTGPIIADITYKGNTIEYMSIAEGIKYQQPLNLVSTSPYFQGGDAVTNPTGSAVFSQRNITVSKRTAFDQWNLQLLTDKYLGKMALPEGSYEEAFAIMDVMTSELVKKAQQATDDFIWNAEEGVVFPGTTVTAAGPGLKELTSGSTFIADGGVAATGVGANAIVGSTAYEQLTAMLADADANILDAEDLSFFVGTKVFQRIVNGLTTQNLFHFDPTSVVSRGGMYEVPLPGYPNVKIVGVYGLRNSERVILGPSSDCYIGVDLLSDTENFKLWYDENTDTIRYRLRNKIGTQLAHPEYWVSNQLA